MTEFLQLVVVGVSTGSAFALVGIGMVLIFRTTSDRQLRAGLVRGARRALHGRPRRRRARDRRRRDHGLPRGARRRRWSGFVAVGFRGRTTPLASLIVTLGIALLISSLNLLAFGDRPHTYPTIFDRAWNIGGVLVQPQYVFVAGVTVLAATLLTLGLQRTIAGQALVACADSRRAAELVGINVRAVAVIAFAVSAALSRARLGAADARRSGQLRLGRPDRDQRLRRRRLRRARRASGSRSSAGSSLGRRRAARGRLRATGSPDSARRHGSTSWRRRCVIMLVLIGWRVAARGDRMSPARALPAARPAATVAAAAFAIWLGYRLGPGDRSLYTLMGLYAIVAIGLSLLMGFAGQISLGQGAFYALGAYTAGILPSASTRTTGWSTRRRESSPALAIVIAPLLTAARGRRDRRAAAPAARPLPRVRDARAPPHPAGRAVRAGSLHRRPGSRSARDRAARALRLAGHERDGVDAAAHRARLGDRRA